jgi:hypothetical protein
MPLPMPVGATSYSRHPQMHHGGARGGLQGQSSIPGANVVGGSKSASNFTTPSNGLNGQQPKYGGYGGRALRQPQQTSSSSSYQQHHPAMGTKAYGGAAGGQVAAGAAANTASSRLPIPASAGAGNGPGAAATVHSPPGRGFHQGAYGLQTSQSASHIPQVNINTQALLIFTSSNETSRKEIIMELFCSFPYNTIQTNIT